MKILILGASGGTGLEIIRQAVDKGHTVTAFVRSPERLFAYAKSIQIKQGNLLNASELQEVVAGHDAVLSAFGPRLPIAASEKHLLRDFANALVPAMTKAGVKRVIVESTAFLFKDSVIPPAHLFGKIFFPSVVMDAGDMEGIFRQSALDWTLVRPPKLTDNSHTGRYRMREGHLPRFGFSISRADVADCFLRLLDDSRAVQRIIGVSK